MTTQEKKLVQLEEKGNFQTGVVLSDELGNRCILDMGAVRWLSKDEFWNLMHPQRDYRSQQKDSQRDS